MAATREDASVRIVNLFALADFGVPLDLDAILRDADGLADVRKSGRAWLFRFALYHALLRANPSGKVRITGARSSSEVRIVVSRLAKLIQKSGCRANEPKVRILNAVAVADLDQRIDPRVLVQRHPDVVSYEPEQFPGAIVSLTRGGVALVFGSGKAVITGLRNPEEMAQRFAEIKLLVQD